MTLNNLHEFVSCYLHEDWKIDSKTIEGAVRQFRSENPAEFISGVVSELRELLGSTNSDEELLKIIYKQIDCRCDLGEGPLLRHNLEHIVQILVS